MQGGRVDPGARRLCGGERRVIRIGRHAVARLSAADLEPLGGEFARHRCLRLPALLDGELLTRLQQRVARAAFAERSLAQIGTQQVARDPALYALGVLCLSREPLFRLLEEVTGMRPIRGFDGQVYRLEAASGEQLDWHDDRHEPGRLLGISINLGERAYQGGRFQIRDRHSGELLGETANPAPGDAVLFDVGPACEHRVTPVEGGTARIALAGWFLDYRSTPFAACRIKASASAGDPRAETP